MDTKVKHEIHVLEDGTVDVDADPLTKVLVSYDEENWKSCDRLQRFGYNAHELRKEATKLSSRKRKIAVTVPGSDTRLEALGEVTNAGGRFFCTGGRCINEDDWFKAVTKKKRKKTIFVALFYPMYLHQY